MNNPQYSALADIYAYLMRKIDYKDWSDYLLAIFGHFGSKDDRVLELGGGNGAIASHLRKYFPSLYLTDLSQDMLMKATDPRLIKVCLDMRHIPFKLPFDLIYSTFDSVNYLLTKKDLKKMFESVAAVSHEETIFTFDASLERNSIKYEKLLNRKGRVKGISFVQTSSYDRIKRIHRNDFEITLPSGEKIFESHIQKIYKFETFFDVIDKTGFYVAECFDAFSFDKLTEKSLRAQFVLKKKR